MRIKIFSLFDFVLALSAVLLVAMGIVFIYSSGFNSESLVRSREYIKQIVWGGTGCALMLALVFIDYRIFARYAAGTFIAVCALLVLTRLFGKEVSGARSWIGVGSLGIQPSEFSKIVFIVFLARFLDRSQNEASRPRFFKGLAVMLVPMGLVLSQPDLGTASVFIPIFMCMCFMAGIQARYIVILFAAGMLSLVFAFLPVWETQIYRHAIPAMRVLSSSRIKMLVSIFFAMLTVICVLGIIMFEKKYYYWLAVVFGVVTFALFASFAVGKVLRDYQIARLLVFIDPSIDRKGAGWNIINSMIAIGSGGIWGRGFLNGPQSHGHFVPQQSTDFIFSIFAEETGFIGCAVAFALYAAVFIRMLIIMRSCPNNFGTYIAAGIFGMFFFHFMENVGMVMGMMPITGIPLLFFSYGGSSLLTAMCAVGILLSINARRGDIHDSMR